MIYTYMYICREREIESTDVYIYIERERGRESARATYMHADIHTCVDSVVP